MRVFSLLSLTTVAGLLLGGCASQQHESYDQSASRETPSALAASPATAPRGKTLTWGGEILSIRNLRERTIIEVLSYPLDDDGRPLKGRRSQGRFLADYPGFLEPRRYSVGKLLTIRGPLLGFTDRKVGRADYRYPALSAKDIDLWQPDTEWGGLKPDVNVGVGVSNQGARGGVGIGFGF